MGGTDSDREGGSDSDERDSEGSSDWDEYASVSNVRAREPIQVDVAESSDAAAPIDTGAAQRDFARKLLEGQNRGQITQAYAEELAVAVGVLFGAGVGPGFPKTWKQIVKKAALGKIVPPRVQVLYGCPIRDQPSLSGKTKTEFEPRGGHHIFGSAAEVAGGCPDCPVCGWVFDKKKCDETRVYSIIPYVINADG